MEMVRETQVPLLGLRSGIGFGGAENRGCKPVACNGCCCLLLSITVAMFVLAFTLCSYYYMPRAAEFQSVTLVTKSVNVTTHFNELYINTTCSVELTVKNNILVNLLGDEGEVNLSFFDTNGLEVLAAYMTIPRQMKIPADTVVIVPFDLTASNIGNNLWEIAAADVLAMTARLRLWGHLSVHDNFLFRVRGYVSCWLDLKVNYVYLPDADLMDFLQRPPDETIRCKKNSTECDIWVDPFPTIHAKATVLKEECEYAADFPNFILPNLVEI